MFLENGILQAEVHLPEGGFYQGTRFDHAGMIRGLLFEGHDFYPPWFQSVETDVRDFIYRESDIVSGLCTAATGPAEEFLSEEGALGFGEAAPGETFVKIGVGGLRRPDALPYDRFRLYDIADPGTWEVSSEPNRVFFTQSLPPAPNGYGYRYKKEVLLVPGGARMVLRHALSNTGTRTIDTLVYNHNFTYLDRLPPGPEVSLTFPFEVLPQAGAEGPIELHGNRIRFQKTLSGEDRAQAFLEGYGNTSEDYNIRMEYEDLRVGLHITGDRPITRLVLWAIRAPLSVEPYIHIYIPPGETFTWNITYDYYRISS